MTLLPLANTIIIATLFRETPTKTTDRHVHAITWITPQAILLITVIFNIIICIFGYDVNKEASIMPKINQPRRMQFRCLSIYIDKCDIACNDNEYEKHT